MISPSAEQIERLLKAARDADWMQVVLNQGPPCFHLELDRFCLRAERWLGHGTDERIHDHAFVPLLTLLASLSQENGELKAAAQQLMDQYQHEQTCRVANQDAVRRLSAEQDMATDYAWPQDVDGLIDMARDWGGVDGAAPLAADVLIHKLGAAMSALQQELLTRKLGDAMSKVLHELNAELDEELTPEEGFRVRLGEAKARALKAEQSLETVKGEREHWKPIETAPKDGTRVLVYVQHGRLNWRIVARTLTEFDGWYSDPGKYHVKPTHWTPLPSPPSVEPATKPEGSQEADAQNLPSALLRERPQEPTKEGPAGE